MSELLPAQLSQPDCGLGCVEGEAGNEGARATCVCFMAEMDRVYTQVLRKVDGN